MGLSIQGRLLICSLGLDGGLGLILTAFTSRNIVCRGKSTPVVEDCLQILDTMPALNRDQAFGKQGLPGVDVGLPLQFRNNGKCGPYRSYLAFREAFVVEVLDSFCQMYAQRQFCPRVRYGKLVYDLDTGNGC